jgi:hypothetical protein
MKRPVKPRIVLENGFWVCYNSYSKFLNDYAQEFCWYLNAQRDGW